MRLPVVRAATVVTGKDPTFDHESPVTQNPGDADLLGDDFFLVQARAILGFTMMINSNQCDVFTRAASTLIKYLRILLGIGRPKFTLSPSK